MHLPMHRSAPTNHITAALSLGLAALLAVSAVPSVAAAAYPSLQKAPDVDRRDDDVAVVVAVEDYAFLPDVEGAVSTADAWENFFRNGLGVGELFVRTDADVTRENMLDLADRAAGAAGEEGRVWYVFVGHGAPTPDGEDGLLVGVDAQGSPQSLTTRGLERSRLLEALESGSQSETAVVIDACFSGNSRGNRSLAEGLQPVVPAKFDSATSETSSTAVLTAAHSDQFAGALPGAERPAFSYLLLGALRGWADDGDGAVTLREAETYTRRQLRHLEHDQVPSFGGDPEMVLTRGATSPAPGLESLMAAARQNDRAAVETAGSKDASASKGMGLRGTGDGGPDEAACEEGRVRNDDTAGHCCWPGQAWNGHRCTGEPTQCPDGRRPDADAESCVLPTCESGKIRASDGVHCCWPNQAWSSEQSACVGEPTCPDGYVARDGSCLADRDRDGIPDADDQCPREAEDPDGVRDDDGCPEEDADVDGIPDSEDECPLRPEDDDGFADDDGCPEPRDGRLTGAYIFGGTGAVAALGGTGLLVAGGIVRGNLQSRLESARTTTSETGDRRVDSSQLSQQRAREMQQRANGLTNAGIAAAGLGAAGLTIGALWMANDPDRPFWKGASRLSVAPRAHGFALQFSLPLE